MPVGTEDWGLCTLGYKESFHLNILSDTSLSFFSILFNHTFAVGYYQFDVLNSIVYSLKKMLMFNALSQN